MVNGDPPCILICRKQAGTTFVTPRGEHSGPYMQYRSLFIREELVSIDVMEGVNVVAKISITSLTCVHQSASFTPLVTT